MLHFAYKKSSYLLILMNRNTRNFTEGREWKGERGEREGGRGGGKEGK